MMSIKVTKSTYTSINFVNSDGKVVASLPNYGNNYHDCHVLEQPCDTASGSIQTVSHNELKEVHDVLISLSKEDQKVLARVCGGACNLDTVETILNGWDEAIAAKESAAIHPID